LRDRIIPISSYHWIFPRSGPTVAKPSVDYIPAGGFVLIQRKSMIWLAIVAAVLITIYLADRAQNRHLDRMEAQRRGKRL
jgi:hypothetical protein